MCAVYAKVGRIDADGRTQNRANSEPYRDSLIAWNDAEERSWEEVRALTGAGVDHLEAHAGAGD